MSEPELEPVEKRLKWLEKEVRRLREDLETTTTRLRPIYWLWLKFTGRWKD